MNRLRQLAFAATLIFALTAVAQQAASSADNSNNSTSAHEHTVPTAETQLKFLATKLDLTSQQQEKIKPMLQELHDATMKLVQDENLSHDDRLSKVRDLHFDADKKVRTVLNEDQKKELDQLEHEPHPELHGAVSGEKN